MSERGWSSEERRVALEQVSQMIRERLEKARVQRGDVSVEACEDHQAMQVAVELQCRLTEMESIAGRALDRANKYMDRAVAICIAPSSVHAKRVEAAYFISSAASDGHVLEITDEAILNTGLV